MLTYKRGFWYGKLSGFLAGFAIGFLVSCIEAVVSWSLEYSVDPIIFGFVFGIVGAGYGTLVGLFIAWFKDKSFVNEAWIGISGIVGLTGGMVFGFDNFDSIYSPIVGLLLGVGFGLIGGYSFLQCLEAMPTNRIKLASKVEELVEIDNFYPTLQ